MPKKKINIIISQKFPLKKQSSKNPLSPIAMD